LLELDKITDQSAKLNMLEEEFIETYHFGIKNLELDLALRPLVHILRQ